MQIIRFVQLAGYILGVAGIVFILFPRLIFAINSMANKLVANLDKGVLGHERLAGLALLILAVIFLLAASIFEARLLPIGL